MDEGIHQSQEAGRPEVLPDLRRGVLVVNVLGVVLGTILFIQPVIALLTLSFLIGIYFLMAGISYILLAFSNPTIRIDEDTIDV